MFKARMGIHLPLAKKYVQIVRRISRCCSLIRFRTSSSRPSGSIASKYYQPGQKGASRRFFKSKYRGLTAPGVISSTVVSGQPAGSRWAIECDEGTRVGSDDTAPPPLAY